MNDILLVILSVGIIPTVIGIGKYIMKGHLDRIQNLEEMVDLKVDEEEVRQLLEYKLDPIVENIQELKVKVDKIMDFLINQHRQ